MSSASPSYKIPACDCFAARFSRGLILCAISAAAFAPLQAFPPAPHYTLYGIARDQVGQTVAATDALVILLKDGVEIGRAPIDANLGQDKNYELTVRLDHNRSGTQLYSDKAIPTQGQFSILVEINGSQFLPIEVTGNLTAGKGGERIRFDLTLGEDTDGDGLPDIWEEWQLYLAGHFPNDGGDWPLHLIDKDGDLDGDGQSNWLEYLAGTLAGDASERFALEIKEKLEGSVRLEFYGITGKTYSLESSPDLKTWTSVPFSIGEAAAGASTYTATNVGILSAFTLATPEKEFYRLSVK